jgi:serine phosphatase RsbU (regulator of sigma subunit)
MACDRALADSGRFRSEAPASRHLECAEVWAGSERTDSVVEMPGLRAWVHSAPSGSDSRGGDVHYVSLCPACTVSRIALADVSGHGQAVAALAEKLRELMLRELTALEQIAMMRDLNRVVLEELDGVHYATMVAAGWHSKRGLLVVTNAGHPPPCWYRAARGEWSWIEAKGASTRGRVAGAPLGLFADLSYERRVLKPELGDLVMLHTDGVFEAPDESGDELGREGLMDIASGLEASSAPVFGSQLVSALQRFRGSRKPTDDETVIVLERTVDFAPGVGQAARRAGQMRAR